MEIYLTALVTLAVGLFGGGAGFRWYSRRKNKAEAVDAETDVAIKLRKMIDETLAEMQKIVKESREKDSVISTSQQTISTQKLMLEVLDGTIKKNNEFMKETLVGWGEMKRAEAECQERCAELEKNDRTRQKEYESLLGRVKILEGN